MNDVIPATVTLKKGALVAHRKKYCRARNKGKRPSQKQLANDLGVDRSTIGRLERGESKVVSWEMWKLVAEFLELDPYTDCEIQAFDEDGIPLTLYEKSEAGTQRKVWINDLEPETPRLTGNPGLLIPRRTRRLPAPRPPLLYFDVDENADFAGREAETKLALGIVEGTFAQSGKALIICISGESGSGKSSVLRAGLLGKLHEIPDVKIHSFVFRPTDFKHKDNKPLQIAADLFGFVAKQSEIGLDQRLLGEALGSSQGEAPAKLAEVIDAALIANGENHFMLVGIDQFEEILDRLNDDHTADSWHPLKRFIEGCCLAKRIGLAYTMAANHDTSEAEREFPAPFSSPFRIDLEDLTQTFVVRVLQHPFEQAHLKLGGDLIAKIMENIVALNPEFPNTSLLPLLSLKRDKWIELVRRNPKFKAKSSPRFLEIGDSGEKTITLEDINFDTDLQNEITQMAEAAVHECNATASRIEEDLDTILHSLVSFSDSESNTIALNSSGPPWFVTHKALFDKLCKYKLIIPTTDGLFRLTHEAVLDHWPHARRWRQRTHKLGKQERKFREKADAWVRNGRPIPPIAPSNKDKNQLISTAAEILYAHRGHWIWNNDLDKEVSETRDYCIALLDLTDAPRRKVGSKVKSTNIINLAAMYGLADLVRSFLEDDSSLANEKSESGATPLNAAAYNQPEVIRILLSFDADPRETFRDAYSAVSISLVSDNIEGFNILHSYCSERKLTAKNLYFPLHWCAAYSKADTLRHVISKCSWSVNERDFWGRLPIHAAASIGQLEALRLLRPKTHDITAKTENKGFNILHLAAAHNHPECIRYILGEIQEFQSLLYEPTNAGTTALGLACANQNPECIKALLDNGIDPNKPIRDRSLGPKLALHESICIYQKESNQNLQANVKNTVLALLSNPNTIPDIPDKTGYTTLSMAVARSLDQVIDLLLQHPDLRPLQPITRYGPTALELCAQREEWDLIAKMIERDQLSPETLVDKEENTPLHILSRYSPPHELLMMIAHAPGVTVNALNKNGCTPLMNALLKRQENAVEILLSFDKIKPAVRGETRVSPLALAFAWSKPVPHLERFLTDNDSPFEGTDNFGFTPLHLAVIKKSDELVKWIEHNAARPSELWKLQDAHGRTPKDFVQRQIEHNGGSKPRGANQDGQVVADGHSETSTYQPMSWDSGLNWKEMKGKARTDAISLLEKIHGVRSQSTWELHSCRLPYYSSRRIKLVRISLHSTEKPHALYALFYLGLTCWLLEGGIDAVKFANSPLFQVSGMSEEQDKPIQSGVSQTNLEPHNVQILDLYTSRTVIEFPISKFDLTECQEFLKSGTGSPRAKNQSLSGEPIGSPQGLPIKLSPGQTLRLTDENVLDYLRFYCFFHRPKGNPFIILEHVHQKESAYSWLAEEDQSLISTFAANPIVEQYDQSEKVFLISAVVCHGPKLCFADFLVTKSGNIHTTSEVALTDDLSSKICAPIATRELIRALPQPSSTD